jgi:PAS domain S-box-containing protein
MRLSEFLVKYGNIYDHPITLVNILLPDQPLIYVNQSFLDMTGFEQSNVIGKNCRLLQGPFSNQESVQRIKESIRDFLPLAQDLVNYKKDGSTFLNRIVLIPFKENEKQFYVGLQHEIDKKIFKNLCLTDKAVLLDRLVNPLAVLSSSVQILELKNEEISIEYIKENYAVSLNQIRNFILSI